MKIITSKNKIIPFIFLFACFASADNVDIKYYLNSNEFFNRDIDIDNDGVADKVISNANGFGDELFFFKNNELDLFNCFVTGRKTVCISKYIVNIISGV